MGLAAPTRPPMSSVPSSSRISAVISTLTEDHGDEAAAALAIAFAERVASVTNAAGGTLVELRGDEALAVFASPRQAIQAAVGIQDRLLEEAIAGTARRSRSGSGSPSRGVPVGDGYRGGALNLAARCARRPQQGRSWPARGSRTSPASSRESTIATAARSS